MRLRELIAAGSLLAVLSSCGLEPDEPDLGNAIELCKKDSATNVETSYQEIGEMLAKIAVSKVPAEEGSETPNWSPGAVFDPTNSDDDAFDLVDQPGEIACVTPEGKLTFSIGGIIVRESQKLTSSDESSSDESSSDEPSTDDTSGDESVPS